jgi:hypothetical protein
MTDGETPSEQNESCSQSDRDTPASVAAFLGFEPPAGQAEALAEVLPDLRRLMALVIASTVR